MTAALWIVGIALIAVGLAGIVLPAIPGVPLVYLGVVAVAWADGFTKIGGWTLGVCGVLTILAVAVDYLAGALGAKKFGATRWGVLGAIAGIVPGFFFGLPGMILGPAIGAVAFEYWKNPDFKAASKAGAGVMVGFAIGIVAKCAIALAILGVAALAYFVN
jgi:uncharacterized protein YqgC (DUF456 family)